MDDAKLLRRHKPLLKYDSQECYFADSAAEWTDNPGNRLINEKGNPIAAAVPGDGEAKLGLGFLGAGRYANDEQVSDADFIGAESDDYRDQASRLHARPKYRNQIYGRAQADHDGRTWLQYWFFYFYNDYNLIGHFLHAGRHEGDWEMIQIRLDERQEPDFAVYAQHAEATGRPWDQIDVLPGTERPIVYVARGSHASYFGPGTHWTGHWFDHADGKRRSPPLKLKLIRDSEPRWSWLGWPGIWGDTHKSGNPLDSGSPRGPATHDQWDDPLSLLDVAEARAAKPAEPRPFAPAPPRVSARRDGDTISLDYEVSPQVEPQGLVVTVNSPDETAPPISHVYDISDRRGSVEVPAAGASGKRYDLHVSVATADQLASESVRCDIGAPSPR